MPIYEYRCVSCGHELEKLQRMSDAPLKDCPACGEAGLRRLVSAAGFRLKGSGWYETDFKKDNRRNVAEPVGEAKSEADKSDGGGKKDTAGKEADKSSGKKSEKSETA